MPPPARCCDRMLGARRATRRAQVLEAHAVVIGALLSALARLIHRRCRQMRPAAGPACIRRVSPRAHTIPHSTAHTGTCSGAHTCARLPMSTCATSHTHTAPLAHALGLTHLCTHAHMHMHTRLPTYTHTHMNTHRHTKEHARTNTHTQTFLCMCDIHMHTHATPVLTHGCLHTHIHT